MDKEAKAALMLQGTAGLTPAVQLRLLARVKTFSAILNTAPGTLKQLLNPRQQVLLGKLQGAPQALLSQIEEQCATLQQQQVMLLPITSDQYPALLKQVSSPPPLLFVKGDPTVLSLPQIGIVGSRRPSGQGINTAKAFARLLAANGFAIVSGMALGIDAQAHNGALTTGKTIAVTGTGIDRVYPEQHSTLQQRILESGGAVVTEFLPGTPPKGEHFPRRNRIISGMSLGILVVEAALKSGSLITAKAALNQGREVFAIPGSIHSPLSKGCHHLIKEGAKLVESADDIVEELQGLLAYKQEEAADDIGESVSGLEQVILDVMGYDPIDMDNLITASKLTVVELSRQLVALELKGLIESREGLFVRCA